MRISEIYLSVQGEGPRVGTPTVFVRFAGCNLRCPGWPCDTPHAIFPERYRQEWSTQTPREIVDQIFQLSEHFPQYSVCLTGGEPFLQSSDQMDELLNTLLDSAGRGTIEAFSNGLLPYSKIALDYVSFVLDWKLPGSGEFVHLYDPRNYNRMNNVRALSYKDAIKFTIADRNDFAHAKTVYENLQQLQFNNKVTFYYGVVWGKLTDAELVKWVLDAGLPWKHTMQVHNYVWDREKRGI